MVLKGCYLRKGKTEQKPAQTELVQLVQSPVSDTAKSYQRTGEQSGINTHIGKACS